MAEDDGLLKARKVTNTMGLRFTSATIGLIAYFKHGNKEKEVKVDKKREQTLFVKSNGYNDFPQILDENGEEFVVTFIEGAVTTDDIKKAQADNDEEVKAFVTSLTGLAKDKSLEKIAKYAKEANMKLALVKLQKGYMVDTMGVIYTNVTTKGTQRKIIKEFIYTNEGLKIEVLKGRNFGGVRQGTTFSTKGIDQIKAMSEHGVKAKAWTILNKVSENLTDLFDAAQFVLDMGNGNRSFSSIPGMSPLAAGVAALGMIGDVEWGKLDQDINELRVQELERRKKQGLSMLRDFVNKDQNNIKGSGSLLGNPLEKENQFVYYLVNINREGASMLLAGKFKTFSDLYPYITEPFSTEVVLLVKKVAHPDFVETIYVVETFFIIK